MMVSLFSLSLCVFDVRLFWKPDVCVNFVGVGHPRCFGVPDRYGRGIIHFRLAYSFMWSDSIGDLEGLELEGERVGMAWG